MEKNENGYRTDCSPKCDCGLSLAMVYSPYQSWRKLYSEEEALKHGTLFEELYKPLAEVCDD